MFIVSDAYFKIEIYDNKTNKITKEKKCKIKNDLLSYETDYLVKKFPETKEYFDKELEKENNFLKIEFYDTLVYPMKLRKNEIVKIKICNLDPNKEKIMRCRIKVFTNLKVNDLNESGRVTYFRNINKREKAKW